MIVITTLATAYSQKLIVANQWIVESGNNVDGLLISVFEMEAGVYKDDPCVQ